MAWRGRGLDWLDRWRELRRLLLDLDVGGRGRGLCRDVLCGKNGRLATIPIDLYRRQDNSCIGSS